MYIDVDTVIVQRWIYAKEQLLKEKGMSRRNVGKSQEVEKKSWKTGRGGEYGFMVFDQAIDHCTTVIGTISPGKDLLLLQVL
jgi:hypothetical protein